MRSRGKTDIVVYPMLGQSLPRRGHPQDTFISDAIRLIGSSQNHTKRKLSAGAIWLIFISIGLVYNAAASRPQNGNGKEGAELGTSVALARKCFLRRRDTLMDIRATYCTYIVDEELLYYERRYLLTRWKTTRCEQRALCILPLYHPANTMGE